MKRFFFSILLYLAAINFVCLLSPNIVVAADGFVNNLSPKIGTDTVITSLYAKTPAEKEYIEKVVAMRDAGEIPYDTFYSAYRYAIKKDKDRRFYYFENTLATFCEGKRISLPNVSGLHKTRYY
ncbi:MAG: hypothetical protein LBU65_09915 [Planctomycetaceae bacterium]|jgi:hypothetical protein|nr:hypothetical protein [Planctomycetaceae bacterium]